MVPKSWHDYRGWLYEIVMNEWPNWWMTLWLFYGSEGHLVRVSLFYIIVWEYTHLLLILSRAHLFIFKICAFFHSKERKKTHMYIVSPLSDIWELFYWVYLLLRVCIRVFYILHSLGISFYVFWARDEWAFPRILELLSFPSFHPLVIWLSLCSDMSLSLFFFFLFVFYVIFFFFSYINTHSRFDVPFTSFLHPLLMVWCFFVSSLLHAHLHWQSFGPWFMRSSTHIVFYAREYNLFIFYHWVFEPSFPSSLHPITVAYVSICVLRPP